MTQDEIFEKAQESGLGFLLDAGFMCHQEVKDFAKLVADKYEQKIQDLEDMITKLQERQA